MLGQEVDRAMGVGGQKIPSCLLNGDDDAWVGVAMLANCWYHLHGIRRTPVSLAAARVCMFPAWLCCKCAVGGRSRTGDGAACEVVSTNRGLELDDGGDDDKEVTATSGVLRDLGRCGFLRTAASGWIRVSFSLLMLLVSPQVRRLGFLVPIAGQNSEFPTPSRSPTRGQLHRRPLCLTAAFLPVSQAENNQQPPRRM